MPKRSKAIALGPRLRRCRNVLTLGVKPNIDDYGQKEISLIRNAPKIYYPSTLYADLFDTMGKQTFPTYHTYKYAQDKITVLENLTREKLLKLKVIFGKMESFFHWKALKK